MSSLYHDIKIEYKTKEHRDYFYNFLLKLSKSEMPDFRAVDIISKLISKKQLEYFKVYLGYEWCFDKNDSPWIGEFKIYQNAITMELIGPTYDPQQRLLEFLRLTGLELGMINYYEIVENTQCGSYNYIWLYQNNLYEIVDYDHRTMYDIQEFEGDIENQFKPVLKEIESGNFKSSKCESLKLKNLSYDKDGMKSYSDYLLEKEEFDRQRLEKEKRIIENSEIKQTKKNNNQIGRGLGSLLRNIGKK